MSIIRGEHNRQNPYAQINKSGLQDTSMSWEAKGLWAYLLSLPDNWQVSVAHLTKTFPAKTMQIRRILLELIALGYCKRQQLRNGNQFGKYEYIIYETPMRQEVETPKIKESFTEAENQLAGKQPLTKKNDKEEIFIRNDDTLSSSLPSAGVPPRTDVLAAESTEPTDCAGDTSSLHIAAFTVFQPHSYKLKNGDKLQYRTACAFAKYTGKALSRLKANVLWYEEYVDSGKPIKRSHEALLQYAVTNDMAAKEDTAFQNSLYAKLMSMEHPGAGMTILKTVVKLKKSDNSYESISFGLPVCTFAKIIDGHVRQNRT